MVADPQDSQRVTSTFRLKYSGEDDDGKWREYEKELIFRHDAPKKRRRTVEETNQKERRELDSMREELEAMKSSLHQDRRQMGGLHHCTACQSKDEDYDREVGKHHCERKLRTGAESSLAEAAEQLSDQGMLVQKLTNEIGLLEKQVKRSSDQAAQSAGAVKRQMAKALEARAREREMRANTVNLETYEGVVEQLKLAKELELETKSAAEHLGWEKEDLEEKLEEKKAELAKATDSRPGRGRHAELQATKKMTELKVDTGVRSMYTSVPARVAENMNAEQLSVRHMAAVLNGRGEGENINLVADALHRAGYLERLIDNADRVQPLLKGMVKEAVTKTQTHWTARHAVHVWDRLELSRSQMETLRHLLSHVYDAATNTYVPIKAWVNPKDDSDFVLTATLAGRWAREKEFERLASKMNIVVGANGRCERDAVECASLLYSNFVDALRSNFSTDRPAQPILFLDGTGGALGRGICHGEMGCADFVAVGDADTKQSRASLQPLFLYEGNDHAGPLRANLDLAISSYNKARTLPTRTACDFIPAPPIVPGAVVCGDSKVTRTPTLPHPAVCPPTRNC